LAVALLPMAMPVFAAPPEPEPSPQEVVEKADEVRFPKEAFQVEVEIVSKTADSEPESRRYRILAKGNEAAIVLTVEPQSERGQALLMRGRDLWVFMPDVSQPIRLSLSQRLVGQVANGDVARANFSGDYTAKVLRYDPCDDEVCYVLELEANDSSVAYHRVVYWVQQRTFHPFKAEFYAISGRLLKTATYGAFKALGGKIRPTEVIIEDAVKKGQSLLSYSGLRLRDLPDKVFSKDYLKRL
jgi:outer membrane lipoprotein-sorting protein